MNVHLVHAIIGNAVREIRIDGFCGTVASTVEAQSCAGTVAVLSSRIPKLIPSLANIDYEPSYAILGGLVFLPCGRPLERQAKAMKLR